MFEQNSIPSMLGVELATHRGSLRLWFRPDDERAFVVGNSANADLRLPGADAGAVAFHLERRGRAIELFPGDTKRAIYVDACRVTQPVLLRPTSIIDVGQDRIVATMFEATEAVAALTFPSTRNAQAHRAPAPRANEVTRLGLPSTELAGPTIDPLRTAILAPSASAVPDPSPAAPRWVNTEPLRLSEQPVARDSVVARAPLGPTGTQIVRARDLRPPPSPAPQPASAYDPPPQPLSAPPSAEPPTQRRSVPPAADAPPEKGSAPASAEAPTQHRSAPPSVEAPTQHRSVPASVEAPTEHRSAPPSAEAPTQHRAVPPSAEAPTQHRSVPPSSSAPTQHRSSPPAPNPSPHRPVPPAEIVLSPPAHAAPEQPRQDIGRAATVLDVRSLAEPAATAMVRPPTGGPSRTVDPTLRSIRPQRGLLGALRGLGRGLAAAGKRAPSENLAALGRGARRRPLVVCTVAVVLACGGAVSLSAVSRLGSAQGVRVTTPGVSVPARTSASAARAASASPTAALDNVPAATSATPSATAPSSATSTAPELLIHAPEASTTGATPTRVDPEVAAAVEALVAGRDAEARLAYARLAARSGADPAYGALAALLTRAASEECQGAAAEDHLFCPEVKR